REYELPPFRESMRYCTSNEKYLRPTRYCNPREPEVIALANGLGAYELSDYEFAEAAYWFVKTKFVVEFVPLNSVSATLTRGTGTCYHLTSVWIALCRAAGIKARYKTFMMMLPDEMMNLEVSEGEAMTADMFNTGVPEGEGEVCIDGKWVVGHVAMRPEIYARAGLPIPKFGEDAMGLTFKLIPGTIKRFESLPLMMGITMKATRWLTSVVMERASLAIKNTLPIGRKIIEEAGGIEAYDQNARERRELPTEEITGALARLTEDAQRKQLLVFEE
ncbi:MAG: transglutaminase family protein, partial [Euryarchaeota archaeon]|nr:transglutaminase family protein [Euryarchaeota archaeon]